MKQLKYIALTFLLLFAASCHSSKQAVAPSGNQPGVVSAVQPKESAPKTLFASLADSYSKWDNVYMPVNISLQAPVRLSVSGRATMVRGKEVHISLRMLGFEVGVLYINSDSIYAFEKLHKYYVAESLKDLLKGADLTVSDLQALLLGQAFLPGKGSVTDKEKADFDISIDNTKLTLTPKKKLGNASILFDCTADAQPVLQSVSVSANNVNGECYYSETTSTTAGNASRIAELKAKAKSREVAAQVKWDFGGAKWNEAKPIKFSIPRGYQRIGAAALLEMLKNF